MNDRIIKRVSLYKMLGVVFNDNLTWDDHVDYMCQKASTRIYFLTLLRRAGSSPEEICEVFAAIVRSVLEYASELWHPGLTKSQSLCIEHIQKQALDIAYPDYEYLEALRVAKLESLEMRREKKCESLFRAIQDPSHKLYHLLPKVRENQPNLRKVRQREPMRARTVRFKNSPINYGLHKFQ